MGVLLDENTRVAVQGFGGAGQREARNSRAYGTQIVCGVTPGRGGQVLEETPVRNTMREAVDEFGANVALIFVPAPFAADAILETADAGIPVAICITEGIPVHDMVMVKRALAGSATTLIGPNCPGVITPAARARAGIMPPDVYLEGNVGVISRSGTLVYETVDQLSRLGIGQSSSVGVGGRPDHRHHAGRGARAVRGRPRHGGRRADRRDRRDGRAGGRGLHRADVEAGDGVHRRRHGASGPPHGPRRRDHRRGVPGRPTRRRRRCAPPAPPSPSPPRTSARRCSSSFATPGWCSRGVDRHIVRASALSSRRARLPA